MKFDGFIFGIFSNIYWITIYDLYNVLIFLNKKTIILHVLITIKLYNNGGS